MLLLLALLLPTHPGLLVIGFFASYYIDGTAIDLEMRRLGVVAAVAFAVGPGRRIVDGFVVAQTAMAAHALTVGQFRSCVGRSRSVFFSFFGFEFGMVLRSRCFS